jgi:O2-independent ubiquinone biosynthesis accessory factor UbiT
MQTYMLPAQMATVFVRLPAYPGAWLFTRGLNAVLAPQLPGDVKAALERRSLRLRITDARISFDFMWQGSGFVPNKLPVGDIPDLTIGACAHDLFRLARREEDPDTLFFSRRLALEGDTELGLLFKNTLDALDVSLLDPAMFWRRARRA